ncbi:SusC/RagA family TonB-linked outer membrane protein [Arachidicoccus terrestris]|uniref:SusC/RagA family TonB-linked outer membrane protein n=1 Tax=Arachidicoccus terrestris TaxID=2875539 RepID=UPI001CC44F89|nr:SusC/RagA family TonB-linked outer membrane protein [Arachidicoccus terrestris]UAY57200.1 SusC/RagA family TonB-linked outer membrane protein [Arachidicoccus terrestris]
MKKSTQVVLRAVYLFIAGLLLWGNAFAQTQEVSGVVKSSEGAPLAGVVVAVKDGQQKVLSQDNGSFHIKATNGDVLTFSYIGFADAEQTVTGPTMEVTMTANEAASAGSDVVVTALGIKRESKSLGYGVQEIKGAELADRHEPNVTNTLSGKVAGLQVIKSSNGPAGSTKIVLRGYNSLTGDNQPLIVVDGIPIDNYAGVPRGGTNDFWNPSLDMGNGLSDINADDIASVSVLKGPAAAALYGSRAGNGVILITTKTGKKQNGLGITVSSNFGMENVFTQPDMQSTYGQGENGVYDKTSGSSWGPEIKGQSYEKWDGTTGAMQAYDNVKSFFNTGFNNSTNVSFSQLYNKTSIYTSFNRLYDKSMLPGSKYERTNLTSRAVSKFGKDDRWTLDTKVQYSKSTASNRPSGGVNAGNAFAVMYQLPRSLDIRDFSAATDPYGNMIWYEPASSAVNPYWGALYNLNSDTRDRFLLNGSLKYQFNDWLNAEIKGGADIYNTATEAKAYAGGPITNQYSQGKNSFTETNYSFLVNAQKDNIFGKFGGLVNVGGNLMDRTVSSLSSGSGELVVPDLFLLNNGKNSPTVSQSYSHQKINSLYGTIQVNYDGYIFLDGTFRNDWSSTLSKDNRSYFYPSLSLSYVFTDMIRKTGGSVPSWFTYGKLRASVAEVGNSLQPYQLYNTYSIGKDPNGNTTASTGSTFYNSDVRSELIKSTEIGTELRFLQSRIGLDVSWYKTNATRQLLAIPQDALSGYSSKMINAGNIQNEGIEVILNTSILNKPESLNWNMTVNFSKNNNKIISLTEGNPSYGLGGYDALSIVAETGKNYGEIYGTAFQRVEDPNSKYYGELLLDGTGLPKGTSDKRDLGNQQADYLLGITNQFSFGGFNLSFLVDGRFGGKIFSATYAAMEAAGTAGITGSRGKMVVDGVVEDGKGGYTKNTAEITTEQYWTAIQSGNIGIVEANLYDATNIRLRNVQLSYNLPHRWLERSPIQRASVGLSCNNVWMISSHMHGIDPESVYATGTNAVGFESSAPPTTRSIMFNLSLSF